MRKLISLEHGDSQRSKSVLQCGEMHISSFGYLSVMVLGSRKYLRAKKIMLGTREPMIKTRKTLEREG